MLVLIDHRTNKIIVVILKIIYLLDAMFQTRSEEGTSEFKCPTSTSVSYSQSQTEEGEKMQPFILFHRFTQRCVS